MALFTGIFTVFLLFLTLALLFRLSYGSGRLHPLPPRFLTGNVHQIPRILPWRTYMECSREYGAIIYYRIFNRSIVVLNSAESVQDLLESRSSNYSDRPKTWMYKKLARRELAVFNISFKHPRFKKYRSILQSGLNSRATQGYRTLQEHEARTLLQSLSDSPDKFIAHIRRNADAIIIKITYEWTVKDDDDYFVKLMEKTSEIQSELVKRGHWLVDVFPILRFVPSWFPGAYFKRYAEELGKELDRIDMIPFAWAKEQIASGNYIPFTSKYMHPDDGPAPIGEQEEIIRWCSGALHKGGAETTVAAMTAFFMIMALYPEVQKKARNEIDQVVGKGRLPRFDNKEKLPYINALVKEVFRWAPVAPLGLSHCIIEEDVYKGYRIPKGCTVIANIWALTHDPDVYPDP